MSLQDVGSTLNSKLPLPVTYVVTSFLAIALYNVVELTITLFLTFKRRSGLYFWSFLVSTWGIALYCIGFFLKDFNLARSITYFYVTFIIVGWSMMVTGQSMVLYSRLHLIVQSPIILKSVLGMIIIDAIILHIPTAVLCYGANSPLFHRFAIPYAVYERVQVSMFFVQEVIISCLYIYATYKMLYSDGSTGDFNGNAGRKLLLRLLLISLIVVALDICILVLEFVGRYASQTAVKGFIYSVKLKLEFSILNQLLAFVRRVHPANSDLMEGSGSGNMLDNQQDERGLDDSHNHRFHCSLAVFARRVQHGLGISADKYVWRVVHIRKGAVPECAVPGSVIIEPEAQVQNLGG